MHRSFQWAVLLVFVVVCSFIIKDEQNLSVVFIGDSITVGSVPRVQSPPRFAGEYLQQQRGIGKVKVANAGISGYTTFNFLPGSSTYEKVKLAADTIQANTNATLIFSIMLGTNDSAIKGPLGAPLTPANYRANLKTITDSLMARYPYCRVIINYPIWYSDSTANGHSSYLKAGQERVLLYQKQIDTLTNLYKKARPQRVFLGDKKAYQYFKENYLTDFKEQKGPSGVYYLHPNQKGDKALGEFWAKSILRSLK
ncbi:GDSL-type esterase/lipase family protein [Mucilaginibacter sp. PAMB04168]|uniref:SGNH/GDSL hydrolase family protein n=1 Tax=Mucilaginibacter sp. PAMB04168 TaxID=3138567 RepID=UPI0031F694A5